MCEFKYCRGTGSCFLSKTSPCPGFAAANDTKTKSERPQSRARSVGLRYEGFLDHDELMGVLEMDDGAETPTPPSRISDVMSAAPRFFRRFQSSRLAREENAA